MPANYGDISSNIWISPNISYDPNAHFTPYVTDIVSTVDGTQNFHFSCSGEMVEFVEQIVRNLLEKEGYILGKIPSPEEMDDFEELMAGDTDGD